MGELPDPVGDGARLIWMRDNPKIRLVLGLSLIEDNRGLAGGDDTSV